MGSVRGKALWAVGVVAVLGGIVAFLLLSGGSRDGGQMAPVTVAPPAPSRPPVTPPQAVPEKAPVRKAMTPEQKEAENARVRAIVGEALRTLAVGRSSAASAAPVTRASGTDAARLWRTGLDEIAQAGSTLDAKQALAEKMALLGRAGTEFLANTARDHTLDVFERDAAVRVLSLIRSRDALAALIKLREPDVMELDYPYDLVMVQAASLPTSEVRAFVPEILQQADRELGGDDLAPERPELLAILALAHGDRRAQALLYDERILNDNLAGAVMAADAIHSASARAFLAWVAERGGGSSAGDVNAILARW